MSTAVPHLRPRPLVLADALADRTTPLARSRARDVVLVSAGVLLMSVLAQVSVPLGFTPVPITGQTLGVVLTAAALGPVRGVAVQAVYIAVGLVGLPVYADAEAGLQVVAGATGGYLVGFLPAALLIGAAARHGADRHVAKALLLFVAGQAVVFAVGVPWLAVAADLSPARAVALGLTPFVLGGVVKAVVAALLLPAAWRLVRRGEQDRP